MTLMAEDMEGCISLGPWGDAKEGKHWSYLPNGSLTQIVIRHGCCVDSIVFQSVNRHNGSVEFSSKFGGPGGNRTDKVCIDNPVEYLTALEITLGDYFFRPVIKSLTLRTNVASYGPFGSKSNTLMSIPVEGGAIVGFHGRSGTYLSSIGVYAMPKCSLHAPNDEPYKGLLKGMDTMKLTLPRDPGPWGSNEGKQWDDGVFFKVVEVYVYLGLGKLVAVRFKYQKLDETFVWSPTHGRVEHFTNCAKVDCTDGEELTGIEGYYGSWTVGYNNDVVEGIKSITLHTNKGKYGPFGDENGTHFTSSLTGGKIVGFSGRSGASLNAIGVHMLYDD